MRMVSCNTLREFSGCRKAMAAVEFALIAPIMFVLFFGMMEASDLMTVKRRIANSANSLSDLVSHDPMITEAQLSDSIVGVKRLLEPTDTSTLSVRVSSVLRGPDPGDPVTVHWSIDNEGGEPYAPGSPFTKLTNEGMVNSVASLIVVEMEYTYVSRLGGRVFTTPFAFEQIARRWPRKSPRVQLCETSDPATCTS